jgi:GT2 family glycosyltransferase
MELSIIIVNYNVKRLVLDCISSIYQQLNCVSFEIIVVDNNSTDDSSTAIKSTFSDVIVISNKLNTGFSEANNQGIKTAKGNYLFLLNPDTYLTDDSICKAIEFVKAQQNNILVAPKLLNADRTLQYSAWKDKDLSVLFCESFRFFNSSYPLESYVTPAIVDNVSGAGMLLKKELAVKVGYFDKDLFFMEDFDFCYRVRKAGEMIYYYPEASIVHLEGKSSEKEPYISYSNPIISKLKFYKKHHSGFKTLLAVLFVLGHLLGYGFFLIIASPFSSNYRKKLLPHFYTIKKFIVYLFTSKVSLT